MLGPYPKALATVALLLCAAAAAWSADEFLSYVHKADSRVEPEEKIVYFSRAIAAWSSSHGNALLAHCLFRRGEGHYSQNDLEHALPDLSKAIDLDPGNARAYLLRGRVFMRLGQSQKASRDFSEALSIKEDPEVFWSLGEAYERSGRFGLAEKAYRSAAQTAPEDFHPQVGLARLQMVKKDARLALEILDAADRTAAGRSPEVLAQRGRCRFDPADAEADLARALSLYEERFAALQRGKAPPLDLYEAKGALARTYDVRGDVFDRHYKFTQALADYEKACGLDLQTACLKEDSLKRRKPVPDPPGVLPVMTSPKKAPVLRLEEEPAEKEQVQPKPKKRYKKVHSDPGERIYGG